MEPDSSANAERIQPGERVFDRDGRLLGHVNGLTADGFETETVTADADAEEVPGQEFGEGYLMWRCVECGEMGELEDGMPATCPDCGAPGEAITAARED